MSTIREELTSMTARAREASLFLTGLSAEKKNRALLALADALETESDTILAANARDLEAGRAAGLSEAMLDRLALTSARIAAMAAGMRKVAALPDPTGLSEGWRHENGMEIVRTRVPLGVIAIVYEARPNVTADAAALCFKSANAVILRGGKEALSSNRAIVNCLQDALEAEGLMRECVQLIASADRAYTSELLTLSGEIDAAIPRGGRGLIEFVKETARVPVIETGAGNCHLYVHADADLDLALNVLVNAKTSRPSVCNAVEHLLVHKDIAKPFLKMAADTLVSLGVTLRGDAACQKADARFGPLLEQDAATEYNDLVLSAFCVEDSDAAIAHISRYSTRHSETICTRDIAVADAFCRRIDAACVYVNASSRFTDGEEFGFGAEIGISTQKLHARGPMGLKELTTVKYIIRGQGQVR